MSEQPTNGFKITLKDVYDIVVGLQRSMAKLEDVTKVMDDHEIRLRKQETRNFPLPTVTVLVSVVALGLSFAMLILLTS